MKFPTKFKTWWTWHEGWVAAGFVAISSFALGYACATAGSEVSHREDMAIMANAYRTALASKDEVITSLAKSTATAADAVATAAATADTTANTAATIADTAASNAEAAHVKAKQAIKPKQSDKLKGWNK